MNTKKMHSACDQKLFFVTHSELEVTLITPGGVPRVFDEPVVQVSGLIIAISDKENAMVYFVKQLFVNLYGGIAIVCIDDAAFI